MGLDVFDCIRSRCTVEEMLFHYCNCSNNTFKPHDHCAKKANRSGSEIFFSISHSRVHVSLSTMCAISKHTQDVDGSLPKTVMVGFNVSLMWFTVRLMWNKVTIA